MHGATAGELRRPDGPLTGTARSLLLVRLASTTAHLGPRLGVVGSLSGCSKLGDDHLVDQGDVDLNVEDLRGEIDRARLLACRVENIYRRHALTSFMASFVAVVTRTRPPLGPGTAPFRSSRPFSVSTPATVRFCVV